MSPTVKYVQFICAMKHTEEKLLIFFLFPSKSPKITHKRTTVSIIYIRYIFYVHFISIVISTFEECSTAALQQKKSGFKAIIYQTDD